MKIKHKMHTSW